MNVMDSFLAAARDVLHSPSASADEVKAMARMIVLLVPARALVEEQKKVIEEMRNRMIGPPMPTPVYGAELIAWADRMEGKK